MEFDTYRCTGLAISRDPVRTADLLIDILVGAGVEVVFGLPGGPISPLHDALLDRREIRVVTTRHESGALFAAAGYAFATGKLGVALVTSGPGVLNAMTGLASAFCDGLPVLLLAGEVARKVFGKGALQDGSSYHLNIVEILRQVTKMAAQAHDANAAPALLKQAIATALSGRRGPVALTLPMDVAMTTIQPPDVTLEQTTTHLIPPAVIDEVARLVGDGRGVAILAGSGARGGRGPERLRDLAERLQCPVFTSPKGKGVFPEDHPLSLGVFGIGGHPSVSDFLAGGFDVLIAIGTGFNDIATDGWSRLLQPRRALVQVDLEPSRIGRGYPVEVGVVAPAELFCALLAARVARAPWRIFSGVQRLEDPSEPSESAGGLISPQRALWEIERVLPSDSLYVCDIGEHTVFATHYLTTNDPHGFTLMAGLGSMGSSIGAALATKLAHPHRTVAAICGDGCFAMNAFELATTMAEELPILVFVFNDARLGMVENGHAAVYGRTASYPTSPMNVAQIARGLDAESLIVRYPGELLAADLLDRLADGSVVVDVRIDPAVRMPRRDRFEAFNGGTRKILN
jgi:acetolactate synthase I/II/III large subunit